MGLLNVGPERYSYVCETANMPKLEIKRDE